jgi:hypothetical protein
LADRLGPWLRALRLVPFSDSSQQRFSDGEGWTSLAVDYAVLGRSICAPPYSVVKRNYTIYCGSFLGQSQDMDSVEVSLDRS